MWRHITGVKRPAETNNQQKDEDESKKSKRRRFNTKWTIGDNGKVREWLIYDRSTDEMYLQWLPYVWLRESEVKSFWNRD